MPKRRSKNNSKSGRQQMVVYQNPTATRGFVPQRTRVILRYMANVAEAVIPTDDYQFRLNSCFDPDVPSAGHQPYGFDQWATLYQKYIVRRCAYDVHWVNAGSEALLVGATCTNSATSLSGADEGHEQSNSQTAVVGISTGKSTARLSGKINLWELEGRTETEYMSAVTEYAAATNANPTAVARLHVLTESFSGSNMTAYWAAILTYEVEFFDWAQPSSS
jgi:hypothetical protein